MHNGQGSSDPKAELGGKFQFKARIQKLDPKGQLLVSREIRELVGIPVGSYVYLKPIGKRRVLIQGLGGHEEFFACVERGLQESGESGDETAGTIVEDELAENTKE